MCCLDLSLGWRNFLDHNLGHGVSSRISISSFLSHAAPNVDSHSNNSLGNSSVVSFTVQLCECWYRFFRGLKKYPSRHQQGRDGSLCVLRDSCARGTFLGVEAERENPACHISYEFWIPPTFVTLVRLEPFDYPIRKSGVIFAYRVARNFFLLLRIGHFCLLRELIFAIFRKYQVHIDKIFVFVKYVQ